MCHLAGYCRGVYVGSDPWCATVFVLVVSVASVVLSPLCCVVALAALLPDSFQKNLNVFAKDSWRSNSSLCC